MSAPVVPAHPGGLCPGSLHPDCRGVAALVEDGHRARVVVVGGRLRQVVGVGSTAGGGGGRSTRLVADISLQLTHSHCSVRIEKSKVRRDMKPNFIRQ